MNIKTLVILIVASTLLFSMSLSSRIQRTYGDSALTLLVSQTLIEDGTIKLNRYRDKIDHYALKEINGNHYDYFPLGTSILAIPAVYTANLLGMDMLRRENSSAVQRVLASLTATLVFVVIFLIGRNYVSDKAALLISLISFMGSSLASSLPGELGSQNLAILINTISLLILVRHDTMGDVHTNPYLLGSLLFFSYLARPTSSIFIVVAFAYLFVTNRRLLYRTAATSLLLFLVFVAFSLCEYGMLLPPYYMDRLGNREFFTALYAILLSPSRGLFVFSPFLLIIAAGSLWFLRPFGKNRMFVLSAAWITGIILIVSSFPVWSGGHSFGPRLLADSIPPFVLISFLLWRQFKTYGIPDSRKKVIVGAYLFLGSLGIYINSYAGLFNPWTELWNKYPNMSGDVVYFVSDWRYPQFLATGDSIKKKFISYYGDRYLVLIDKKNMTIKTVDMHPVDTTGYLERGTYLMEDGRLDEAFRDLSAAIRMNPGLKAAYVNRGLIYQIYFKSPKEAIADFNSAIALGAEDAEVYISRARSLIVAGRSAEAVMDLKRALSISPGSTEAKMLMESIAAGRSGSIDKAEQYEQK